jgi:5-methylcytosine-specific restriction endonuclease McrA
MLNSAVLVLNRSWMPVHITTAKRAFCLLYHGAAKAVDEQFEMFDFDDWSELRPREGEPYVGLVNGVLRIPKVIVLLTYDRMPKRAVRFSRKNIYMRDKYTCQYCGVKFAPNELNIDHIIPRSRGGKSTWDNVVCSCHECNRRKGGHTPEEMGMKLITKPRKPRWTPYMGFHFDANLYKEWLPFLNFIDAAYWNVELDE